MARDARKIQGKKMIKAWIAIGIIACVVVLLQLSGCEGSSNRGKDGYVFQQKEYEKTNVEIEFVILRNAREFREYQQRIVPGVEGVQAFGELIPSQNKCILYIKDPNWKYEPEWIGHEVAHCIWGRWHSN